MSGGAPTQVGTSPAGSAQASGGGFFSSIEHDVVKVAGFIGHEVVAAERFFGSKTGPAKLRTVLAAATTAMSLLGWNVGGAEGEVVAVVNALVALFNKAGQPIA